MTTHNNELKQLKEKLAAIEHERWADWQKWCNGQIRANANDIESPLRRWDKQIDTPYAQLSDKEKASDMEQVDRYWHLIEAYIQSQIEEARIDELETMLKPQDCYRPFCKQEHSLVKKSYVKERIAQLKASKKGLKDE